jgi:putative salt-induced outer membrane protein YdiY
VNVQSLADDRKPGATGGLDLTFDLRTGNTTLLHLGANALIGYRKDRTFVFLLGRAEYGITGAFSGPMSSKLADRDLEHLRVRYRITDWFSWELFGQHDRDSLRRLSLRLLAGTGPRFRVAHTTAFTAFLGVAYMSEHEEVTDDPKNDSPGEIDNNPRMSSYAAMYLKLAEHLKVSETLYVQPNLRDPGDDRVLSDTELTAQATTHVALKITFSVSYDSEPPRGIRPTDTLVKTALSLSL